MIRHGIPAGLSVLLGVVVAVIVNAFTDGWRWQLGLGLAGAVVAATAWEIWRATRHSGSTIRAEGTGPATARSQGSRANSGVRGAPATDTVARRTGAANATGGGTANSGVDITAEPGESR